MPPQPLVETTYLGLELFELLTLFGIILGPIVAVLISIFTETRRRKREGQIQVMRMLLNTRHLPGDPTYSIAINLVPVEFNKSKAVMAAWKEYIEIVRFRPTPENEGEHERVVLAKQTTLIFKIMRSLKFELSETDIQNSAYASGGFIERDNLYLDALRSLRQIADSTRQLTALNEAMLGAVTAQQEKAKN